MGQLSYKLAYRIAYIALIFLSWLLQFVFPDFNKIHLTPLRSGLLIVVSVATGIKALARVPEKITWIVGGATGITIYFVHRIILKTKFECTIKLLMLYRKYEQKADRDKSFDIDYIFPYWRISTILKVFVLKVVAIPFYMVSMAVTKMKLVRLQKVCEKIRNATLLSWKYAKFKYRRWIPIWGIKRKLYLTLSDRMVLSSFEKSLKKREKYCENLNVIGLKSLERLVKMAFWSPADYTLIIDFIAMQYINYYQGPYVLGLASYNIFTTHPDIQYLKYLQILVQSKFPSSTSVSLTYASVLLRVLEDYERARSEMVADQTETFTLAFNTYFILNKELI